MLIGAGTGIVGPRRLRIAFRIFVAYLVVAALLLLVYDVFRVAFFDESVPHALDQNWRKVRPDWGSIPGYVLWTIIFIVCYRRDRADRQRAREEEPTT